MFGVKNDFKKTNLGPKWCQTHCLGPLYVVGGMWLGGWDAWLGSWNTSLGGCRWLKGVAGGGNTLLGVVGGWKTWLGAETCSQGLGWLKCMAIGLYWALLGFIGHHLAFIDLCGPSSGPLGVETHGCGQKWVMGGWNALLGSKCVNGGQQVCTIEEMNKKTCINEKKKKHT